METLTIRFTTKTLLRVLYLVILFITTSSIGQVKTPFTPRFSDNVNGDFTLIANNVLSRHATDAYNGFDSNHDFTDNVYVDIDTDPTTFNSSSATLVNPSPSSACLTIRKAYLYWAAANMEYGVNSDGNISGNGGSEIVWNFNQIKFMLPGSSTYQTITADEIIYDGRAEHFVNDPYVCVKEITSDVQGLSDPYGKYQVANVKATEGDLYSHGVGHTGTSGGWQIVFVYESVDLVERNITIFDGFANVTALTNNFDVDFNGFQTIPNGEVKANIVMGALEGDYGLIGDELQILDTAGNWTPISTTLRDTDNFFNSKITVNGSDFTTRNPASLNTLGYDASIFPLANSGNSIIDNDQTSATIRMTSNQETYGLFVLGLSVEVYEPSLGAFQLTTSLPGTNYNAGDTVQFSLDMENSGNDDIRDLELTTIIPNELEFVDTETLPTGVTYSYDAATNELTFNVPDGLTDVGSSLYTLDFNTVVKDQCYFLETNCASEFQIQTIATFRGVTNSTLQTVQSSGSLDSCGLGNHDMTTGNINTPNIVAWLTNANDLDRTVLASDTAAITNAQLLEPVTEIGSFTINKNAGSFAPSISCPTEGTYTNTFTFTDACGRTSDVFTQIITVIDNDCYTNAGLKFQPTSITINEGDGLATFNVILSGVLPGGFTVDFSTENDSAIAGSDYEATNGTLSFVGTDGETHSITVVITDDNWIENTESFFVNLSNLSTNQIGINAPQAIGYIIDNDMRSITPNTYTEEYTIMCSDMVPEVPELVFTGGCDDYMVDFSEVIERPDNMEDYIVVRSWVVVDACNNTATFEQIINVTQPEKETVTIEVCIEDMSIDLLSYLPDGFDPNGIFVNNTNTTILDNNLFEPIDNEIGVHLISYNSTVDSCNYQVDFEITVNSDCVPCSIDDIIVSTTVTANNDNINDYFEITGAENCNFNYDVILYNRWGAKVYESTNYLNDWGGNSPNNSIGKSGMLPTGTYYYIIKVTNADLQPLTGYIYLGTK